MRARKTAAIHRCVALAALVALGAGCGGRAGGPSADARVVRFDLSADPATLNPLFAHADAAEVEQQLAHLAFEPFFDLDARGRPVPELLERIPTIANGGLSRDGRTITYRLRRGVLWSDGVPVTSHKATITVVPDGSASHVTWDVEVEPDEMTELMQGIYQQSLGALKEHLGG